MDEIKERINNLISDKDLSLEVLQTILSDIQVNDNEEEKKELFDYLVKELSNEIKTWKQTKEEAQQNVDKITEKIKVYSGLTEVEIEELFKKYNFTVENILSEEEVIEENEENENTNTAAETNEEVEENVEAIVNEEQEENIEKREIEIINERISELEQELTEEISLEELDVKISQLEQEKKQKIKEVSFENNEYERLKLKVNTAYADQNYYPELKRDQKRLEELKKEITYLPQKYSENQLLKLQEEYEKLKRKLDIAYADRDYYPEMKEEQNRLEEIKKEIKKFEELEKFKKEIQSNYDKKIAALQNIKNKKQELEALKKIPPAYEKIKNDAISNFESQKLDEDALKNAVNDYLNNHSLINELNNYANADKLKQELKEEICENLKTKKIEKQEQNQKLRYKGLAAAAAGFGTGLILSSVPGVGTIRMGVAVAKLASSAINYYTKKHPEGKISQIIESSSNKIKNSTFIEKHPKLIEKITNLKNKIKNVMESKNIQYFINGVAAGYLTGNIIEMITGETLLENIKPNPTPPPDPGDVVVDVPEPEPVPPVPTLPEPVPPVPTLPEQITINPGDVLDISGLEYGLTNSYSSDPVHLLTEVGKSVEVDKFNVVNGETMVHFKQLNGKGYAWFKLSDVQELLAKTAEAAKSTGMKL